MQDQEIAKLRRNIPKLYLFSFFQMFLVIIPVIVPFWQAKGLSIKEIFILQGIFGGTLIILDLPAGYIADLFGRKKTMIIGSIISALGFQILWMGQSFFHFAVYEIILGIGISLQSGCDVALLYNSLDKLKGSGRTTQYLGRRHTAQTLGEGTASLLGGLLAGIALDWPAYANAIFAWVPVFVALAIYEPEGQRLPGGTHLKNFKLIGKSLFGHSRLLTLAITSFIFYGFATYCAVWTFQPYWKSRGMSVAYFGYLWAANSFMAAIISRYAHAIEEKLGSVSVVVIISLLPIIGYLGMGWVGAFGIIFSLAFPICRGLNHVIFNDAINSRVPAEVRATTNSVGSLGVRALFLVFGPVLGSALDAHGPDYSLRILGIIYIFGFFLITLPLLKERRNFRTT